MSMFDPFFAWVDRWILRIDQQRSVLFLFAALAGLLLLQMWPAAWIGNEENYFQLAYRTFAPEKFFQFSAVFDMSRARAIPLYVLGSVVQLLGYDGAHSVTRILVAILYAAGLAYFFSALRLSVWDALVIIAVFELADENLIGGEWLFQGVESKVVAYALMFFSFGLALRQRWTAATVVGVAATYMHFLVGGFWTLMLLVQQWMEKKERRDVRRCLAVYAILTLPLVLVIALDELGAVTAAASRLADQIYAQRNSWHVAPFGSRSDFWTWTPGVANTLALLLVLGAVSWRFRAGFRPAAIVSRTAFFGLAYLVLALVAAFVDRDTQFLAKFFLFRPSSLTLLLALTAVTALLSERLRDDAAALKAGVALALVASFSWRALRTQVDRSRTEHRVPEQDALVAAVVSHTAPGDIVLLEPGFEDPDHLRLHRLIPRPTLVSAKFVPSNPADILRWHSYVDIRDQLFTKGCVVQTQVPVRWLVTFKRGSAARLANCGPPVWQKGDVALIARR